MAPIYIPGIVPPSPSPSPSLPSPLLEVPARGGHEVAPGPLFRPENPEYSEGIKGGLGCGGWDEGARHDPEFTAKIPLFFFFCGMVEGEKRKI